jgi:hypothetical protein
MTPKVKRRWIKQEKRIVRLLYRKGFLKDFKIKDLYWAEYNWLGRKKYRTKPNRYDGKFYRFPVYMPEVHYCTTDYWGESDEHSIVSHVLEVLHWSNIDTENWDETSGEWPKSTFKMMTRDKFIRYLNSLPTINSDNKINRILKKMGIDD